MNPSISSPARSHASNTVTTYVKVARGCPSSSHGAWRRDKTISGADVQAFLLLMKLLLQIAASHCHEGLALGWQDQT